MVLSQAIEDYLKAIFKLEADEEGVATSRLADTMEVSSASATNMIKRLDDMGLVNYQSYQGATLTESGRKMALEIIRHHRLLELYLLEKMGYSWDEVHDEAEKLEHHISEQFEDKIAELLGDPTHDPHGDPIPTKEGIMPKMDEQKLVNGSEGQAYIIGRVLDQDPERLRYLEEQTLLPGAKLEIKKIAPFDGPLTLLVEEQEIVIGYDLARTIFVTPL